MTLVPLKEEIAIWASGITRFDAKDFDAALDEFARIGHRSKMQFNLGVVHSTLHEYEKAVDCYQRAIALDKYLAVAHFQLGVSHFLLGKFEDAIGNFTAVLTCLHTNTIIDYSQLGLCFRLYSNEVTFNRALCYLRLGKQELAVRDLTESSGSTGDSSSIPGAEGTHIFSVPAGVLYRPDEAKVRNLGAKNYLGKPRLVAASGAGLVVDETGNATRDNITRIAASVDEKSLPPTPLPEEAWSVTNKPSACAASAGCRTTPLSPLWVASAAARQWRRCGDSDQSLQDVGRDTTCEGTEPCCGEASTEGHNRSPPRPLDVSREPYNALTDGREIFDEPDQLLLIYGKVHLCDRVQYLLMDRDIQLEDLKGRLRDKLDLQGAFVIQTRDGNDMVTIEDQEDLTVAVYTSFGGGQLKNENRSLGIWVWEREEQ